MSLSPTMHIQKPGDKGGRLKISHTLNFSGTLSAKGTERDHELLLLCEVPAKWWNSHANNPKTRKL